MKSILERTCNNNEYDIKELLIELDNIEKHERQLEKGLKNRMENKRYCAYIFGSLLAPLYFCVFMIVNNIHEDIYFHCVVLFLFISISIFMVYKDVVVFFGDVTIDSKLVRKYKKMK